MSYDKVFKLILAGDAGVGKTEIVNRYISGIFDADTRITIGVEFYIKDLVLEGFGDIRLQVWDMQNEDRFRFLLPTYMKGASGVMFLYSTIDKKTLDHFDDWLPILRNYDPNIPILLVGTKIHLKNQRKVKKEEAIEVARNRACVGYAEVSVKENINIEQTFHAISLAMWHYIESKNERRRGK